MHRKRKVPKSPQPPTQQHWNPDGFFLQNSRQRHERLMSMLALQNANELCINRNDTAEERSNWGSFAGIVIGSAAFASILVYTVIEYWATH